MGQGQTQSQSTVGVPKPGRGQRFSSFADLARHLDETDDGLERIIYPSLRFGAAFWIPDAETGFGSETAHPWVIIGAYQPGRPTVVACPRTSSRPHERGLAGLVIPAGVIAGLDKEGCVLLDLATPFMAYRFREYDYVGTLDEKWCARLRAAIHRLNKSEAGSAGAPTRRLPEVS